MNNGYQNFKSAVAFFFLFFLHGFSIGKGQQGISYNGLHIAEGGEYEAQNLNLKQMFYRSKTVYFSTKTPLLAICCYVPFFFINLK